MVVCKHCGKLFETKGKSRGRKNIHCSDFCRLEYSRKSANAAAKRKREIKRSKPRVCKNCGVEFLVSMGKELYCSKECRAAFMTPFKSGKVVHTCTICGKDYKTLQPEVKTCGKECSRQLRLNSHKTPKKIINRRMRCGLRRGIDHPKGGHSWTSLVGYSAIALRNHLEGKFTDGMGWHNIGDWHIDHIKPLDSFNFNSFTDDEFKKAWALGNLQPLWALDNMSKGAKYGISKEAA